MNTVWIILIGITIYFNIGWILGYYYHNKVFYVAKGNLSILGKIAAGGWYLFANLKSVDNGWNRECRRFFTVVFWSFFVLMIISAWFLWLIFAGGIFKLIWPSLKPSLKEK